MIRRSGLMRAIHLALRCDHLPDEARDDIAAAMGLIMRRTGCDLEDARARILRASECMPDPDAIAVMTEALAADTGEGV